MTAFAAAADAIFADPNLGLDALWHAGGTGPGVPVRVVRSAPDTETAFGATRIITDADTFSVRTSQVAEPRRGDRLRVGVAWDGTAWAGGDLYVVKGEPRRDRLRLVWTVDADPQ